MYHRTPSPIFDAPEFPTLRRVLPLPKRRRTMTSRESKDENSAPGHLPSAMDLPQPISASGKMIRSPNHNHFTLPTLPPIPSSTSTYPLPIPLSPTSLSSFPTLPPLPPLPLPLDALGPNPTAEELIAHADTVSTRMALQNYYLPLLGNVQNFLASHAAANGSVIGVEGFNSDNTSGGSNSNAAAAAAAALAAVTGSGRNGSITPLPPLSELNSLEFGVHFAAAAAAAAAAGVTMGGLGNLGAGLAQLNMDTNGTSTTNVEGDLTSSSTTVNSASENTNYSSLNAGCGTVRANCVVEDGTGYVRGGSLSGGDGDYCERDTDHIRHPGNTKKRKVPANIDGSPRGGNGTAGDGGRGGSPSSFLDDDGGDPGSGGFAGFVAAGTGLAEALGTWTKSRDRLKDQDPTTSTTIYPPTSFPGQLSLLAKKKGKLTAATLAGLQHKELLKARKRQLAAVMGALSHGDTLALDQALSTSYPLDGGKGGGSGSSLIGGSGDLLGVGESLKIRKSKRMTVRLARVMKALLETPERKNPHPDAVPFPVSGFEFKCASATADRLIATKEEVAALRKRFEAELARQAAKAAKLALAVASGKTLTKTSGRAKRERQEREREKAVSARLEKQRSIKSITGGEHIPEPVVSRSTSTTGTPGSDLLGVPGGGGGGKVKNGKKKKRSALANASNPHHLRNYVPSRLPHTGVPDGVHDPQATSHNAWPLPVRFLSSEIPARRSKGGHKKAPPTTTPLVQLTRPAEEWVCAFCEYDLFYSDDASYRKAVRNRKKILKRRQRAAEKAASTARGKSGATAAKDQSFNDHEEENGNNSNDGLDEFSINPSYLNPKRKAAPDKDQGRAVG